MWLRDCRKCLLEFLELVFDTLGAQNGLAQQSDHQKYMSKKKWKEDWIAEESDIKGKRVYIESRLQKIVNVVAKKLIKER